MSTVDADVIVVGAGVGGLCAATLLAAWGHKVIVLEAAEEVGGKAGTIKIDGVEVDTGPSVLTLPEVFDEVFLAAGMKPREQLQLLASSPGFRYLYADGVELDVFHDLSDTLDSVERTLGPKARVELAAYMTYARKIWEAAAPHFVMSQAPSVSRLLLGGLGALGAVSKIDPFNTLSGAIQKRIRSPHLRRLLMRYATYNGSDARTAPATLGCISHVELALGGYGVRGGMAELPRALARAAEKAGAKIVTDAKVEQILVEERSVQGVRLDGGTVFAASQVVMNGDVAALFDGLLLDAPTLPEGVPSMSAYCGVYRAKEPLRSGTRRAAHTVLFMCSENVPRACCVGDP
jgi:phytoene desaturase